MFIKIKKGFTLIELLVVIAIIAILAAILFPVFAQAREKARQTSCLSNCKQIGTAVQLYVDDYDETYPCNSKNSMMLMTNIVSKGSAAVALEPYIKNWGMWRCPSSRKCDVSNDPNWRVISYMFNGNVIGIAPSGVGPDGNFEYYQSLQCPPRTVSELQNTSAVMFCWETPVQAPHCMVNPERRDCQPWHPYYLSYMSIYCDTGIDVTDRFPAIHNGGQNVCWCDGHAKYMKRESVLIKDLGGPGAITFDDAFNENSRFIDWTYMNCYCNY